MIKPYWPRLELASPARGFAEDYSRALRKSPPEVVMAAGQPLGCGRREESATPLAEKKPIQYIKNNFYVTTSGMFRHPVL
jgi:hypothetical protein